MENFINDEEKRINSFPKKKANDKGIKNDTIDAIEQIIVPTSFDDRFVNYEKIHNIQESDWRALVDAIDIHKTDTILEGCCGYGEVTKKIFTYGDVQKIPTKITLLDNSVEQLERAKNNLKLEKNITYLHSTITKTPIGDNSQDKVVIKMGIHEMSPEKQIQAFMEIYRVLKPRGKFIMWDIMLFDETKEFWNAVIRKKDELCNFTSLKENRHFLSEKEIYALFHNAGFKNTICTYSMFPRLNMRDRYMELISKEIKENPKYGELYVAIRENKNISPEDLPQQLAEHAERKLQMLLQFVRSQLESYPEIIRNNIIKQMHIEDKGHTMCFSQRKVIMTGEK